MTPTPPPLSTKILPPHLERIAIVYIRQSTLQQVLRHQESTRLQYALVERAVQLGWQKERVLVIDEDLGRSGSTTEGRQGFQRLVAEVGLSHVGLVLGLEMSRLARSCRDWHHLLEVCALFGTLLGDNDGVYDPTRYNDRLLLGLKGTMSEAELHLLKERMLRGKEAKAQRGELGMPLPMGYARRPSGEIIQDPDEQARQVIELVFACFTRMGTIYAVLRYLVEHGIRMPYRLSSGSNKGELEWRRPNRISLSNLLHNPMYAGAYVYGRRPTDPRRQRPGRPGTGRTVAMPEQWPVLLKDHLPAYITWEQYERNLRQLRANTASAAGTIRRGPALLCGLLVCGRCGQKMSVHYSGTKQATRYLCSRKQTDYAEPLCQSLVGKPLEEFVSDMVLRAMEPASLEISLQVAEDLDTEHEKLIQHWKMRLERASYESERAFRQYDQVEPENRLVARSLEKKWEETLAAEKALKEEYERWVASQQAPLSEAEREEIRKMAQDLPSLWKAPTTGAKDRQAIIRHLVERVVVTVQGESEEVAVEIHWVGGHCTGTTLVRPVARLEQLSYYPQLLERVCKLRERGKKYQEIAEQLNREGWRPPKRRETFNAPMVQELWERRKEPKKGGKTQKQKGHPKRREEWGVSELARELEIPSITLYAWLRKGLLCARRDEKTPHREWRIRADAAELERLRTLRNAPRTWTRHRRIES